MNLDEIREAEFHVCKNITFISPEQIGKRAWLSAEKLVEDIDPKDIQYIAYARHFRCKLWSGDKQLITGLAGKGYKNVLTTKDIYDQFSSSK